MTKQSPLIRQCKAKKRQYKPSTDYFVRYRSLVMTIRLEYSTIASYQLKADLCRLLQTRAKHKNRPLSIELVSGNH